MYDEKFTSPLHRIEFGESNREVLFDVAPSPLIVCK
jgi:hypothetical protein